MLAGLLFWVWTISNHKNKSNDLVKNTFKQENLKLQNYLALISTSLPDMRTTKSKASTWSTWPRRTLNLSPRYDHVIPCFDRCQLIITWISLRAGSLVWVGYRRVRRFSVLCRLWPWYPIQTSEPARRLNMNVQYQEVHGKLRLHVSVNLLFGVWRLSWAISSPLPPSCIRAYQQHR